MKKTLIGVLIIMTVSLLGCKKDSIPNPSTENQIPSDQVEPPQSSLENNNTGDESSRLIKGKQDTEKLYMDLEMNFKKQTERFNKDSWEKFSSEFANKKEQVKKRTLENEYLNEAISNLENLYSEYNKALRENIQIGKEKIEKIKNNIQENLKKIKGDL